MIYPSQPFGFRFEHKRKHHIVAHRLDNQWEIAVICFAPATIVLMREFRTRKRETSELSAHPHTVRSVFCLSFFDGEREREERERRERERERGGERERERRERREGEREERAERERERERAAANPSSGRSFRHYNIKRIHTPYYTEHSKKAFGKQCFCSFEHACQHF